MYIYSKEAGIYRCKVTGKTVDLEAGLQGKKVGKHS
jgi:hypothetical protein